MYYFVVVAGPLLITGLTGTINNGYDPRFDTSYYDNYPPVASQRLAYDEEVLAGLLYEPAKAPFPVRSRDAAPGIGDVEWQTQQPPRAREHRAPARAIASARGRRPMRGRSGRPHDAALPAAAGA